MKILVTEKQIRFIHEQIEASKVPLKLNQSTNNQPRIRGVSTSTVGDYSNPLPDWYFKPDDQLTDKEKWDKKMYFSYYKKPDPSKTGTIGLPSTDVSKMYSQSTKKVIDPKLNPDLAIDIVSAAIDTVPGVGNVVSFAIDELHGISYFVRAAMTSGLERTEFILLGLVTAALGFVPVGGNIASAGIKQGIKNVLKLTPDQIQKWAISKGIIKYRILFDIKRPWWPNWWLFVLKLSKTLGVDGLVKQVEKLKQPLINIKSKLQKENLLILGLDEVLDTVISWLELPTPAEFAVMEEMIDKGIL
jgi:hypothetical protein